MLPKIHKISNPGRPFVSACACAAEQISVYLDSIFQPLVTTLQMYIKDTNHALTIFVEVIIQTNEPISLFLLEVISLYTSIPHANGLQAVKYFLNMRIFPPCSIDTLVQLIELVLTLNSFEFAGEFFAQISWVAIGTKMGPSYVCLLWVILKPKLNAYQGPQLEHYYRYIDDSIGITRLLKRELKSDIDSCILLSLHFQNILKFA